MNPKHIGLREIRELGQRIRIAIENGQSTEALLAASILMNRAEILRLYADSLEVEQIRHLRLVSE